MARRLLVAGAKVAGHAAARADVLCEHGRITAVAPGIDAPDAEVVDATGLIVGPGFVDIHVHGGGGHSFFTRDATEIEAYRAWAPRNGVTSFLISTLGRKPADTQAILASLHTKVGRKGGGAEVLGFHLEGPFINPHRRGAFPEGMLRAPDVPEFARYQEAAGGHIRQVTIAPELPGAIEVIRAIAASGAVPAIGHTDATFAEVVAGVDAGASHVTHLFNAMRSLHQREGGPIAAALASEGVTCEVICDGAHVSREVVQLAFRLLGLSRMVVVTDNLHLAGAPATSGRFAGSDVAVEGAMAVRDDGTIVGSVETMDQHFRNVREFCGLSVETAFRLCATNPADVVGAGGRKGRVAPGYDADLVLVDEEGEVRATICAGEVAFERAPAR